MGLRTPDPRHGEQHYYTCGHCGLLAVELHKITGWPIHLLVYPEEYSDFCNGIFLEQYGHALVSPEEGILVDFYGIQAIDSVMEKWYADEEGYELINAPLGSFAYSSNPARVHKTRKFIEKNKEKLGLNKW